MSPRAPIPFTVIGGYLGAGKTTLVNEILTEPHGVRFGVLVNDVGEVAVDETLIASASGDTVTLTNGCICCSIADGFGVALDQLRDADVDHVVVEVSGVGDPWKVAQWGRIPGFELDAVITLADVESIADRADDKYVGDTVRLQLAGADLVVLTHVDVADPAQVEAVATWVGTVTEAPVLAPQIGARAISELLAAAQPGAGAPVDAPHAHHLTRVVSGAASPAAGDREGWLAWLTAAPRGVVRVKGFVEVADGTTLVVQRAGHRAEVRRWHGDDPPCEIVVIATPGVDPDQLDKWCQGP